MSVLQFVPWCHHYNDHVFPGVFINHHGNLVAWVGHGDGLRLVAAAHGQVRLWKINTRHMDENELSIMFLSSLHIE